MNKHELQIRTILTVRGQDSGGLAGKILKARKEIWFKVQAGEFRDGNTANELFQSQFQCSHCHYYLG